jgi:3-oxoacyl-[acyl-carrier protein] reductase
VAAYIGTIDPKPLIVINNAGINPLNLIENISSEDAVATMNIMYHSPLALIKACVPTMKSHSFGRIVNIGSIWSVVSKPGRLVYSSAKHALDGITNTLAVELAPNGILVNTVCPGFTDTEMTSQNNTPEEIAALCQSIPLGRLARPQEIAGLVHFLGSERNTYITGQKITIDGGFTCA